MRRWFIVTTEYRVLDIGNHEDWAAAYRFASQNAQPFFWIYDEMAADAIADVIIFGLRDRQKEYPDE